MSNKEFIQAISTNRVPSYPLLHPDCVKDTLPFLRQQDANSFPISCDQTWKRFKENMQLLTSLHISIPAKFGVLERKVQKMLVENRPIDTAQLVELQRAKEELFERFNSRLPFHEALWP